MTMHSEIPDDLGEPLDQHSDTLDGIRHRAYREQSREDTVGIMICDKGSPLRGGHRGPYWAMGRIRIAG